MKFRIGIVALAAAAALIAGCSSGGHQAASSTSSTPKVSAASTHATTPPASSSTGPATTTPSPSNVFPVKKQPDKPVVDGAITVLWVPYGLPHTTGYDTAVAMYVKNPSDFPMISPYRVTVFSGGRRIAVTDGTDAVVLAPHERKPLVVHDQLDIEGAKPATATITFYANEAGQVELPTAADWRFTNRTFNCNNGLTQCDANADITYTGHTGQYVPSVAEVDVIVHRSQDNSGPVVAAGTLTPNGPIAGPNEPAPMTGYITYPNYDPNVQVHGDLGTYVDTSGLS